MTANNTELSRFIHTALQHDIDHTWLRSFYQRMHAHPELSTKEVRTAALIAEALQRYDCEVIDNIGGYGLVAIFRNGPGPTVLMRADFDGLPVKEETGASFASQQIDTSGETPRPVMHACGHDMHTSALLGTCAILDKNRDTWRGTYIALFQPSEENGEGAQAMVNDGLVHRIPRPDICFGQHIVAGPAGKVMTMPGSALAGCDSLEIKIFGQSAHGSMPHNSLDPTYVAALIVLRLQGIVGREINPDDFAVASVGTLESGHSNNTIPGEARIVVNCRTYSDAVRTQLYQAIQRVAKAECLASGFVREPEFRFFAHGPITHNAPEVFRKVRARFDEVLGENSRNATRWTASEDFANIPQAFGVPYFFWTVGCTPRAQWDQAVAANTVSATIPVNHMPTFLPDYAPTLLGCVAAATTAALSYFGTIKSQVLKGPNTNEHFQNKPLV